MELFAKIGNRNSKTGVSLCEIFKNTIFTEHLWWLLLIPVKDTNLDTVEAGI